MFSDDSESGDNDGAGGGWCSVGGCESRKRRSAAYSNSVPTPIAVGNPLFILQQGQSPLHVALPVVCRTGEFPNDYFHRTKSRASENSHTAEI